MTEELKRFLVKNGVLELLLKEHYVIADERLGLSYYLPFHITITGHTGEANENDLDGFPKCDLVPINEMVEEELTHCVYEAFFDIIEFAWKDILTPSVKQELEHLYHEYTIKEAKEFVDFIVKLYETNGSDIIEHKIKMLFKGYDYDDSGNEITLIGNIRYWRDTMFMLRAETIEEEEAIMNLPALEFLTYIRKHFNVYLYRPTLKELKKLEELNKKSPTQEKIYGFKSMELKEEM